MRLAYLETYDIAMGKRVTAGVDVWRNTPEPPLEASGSRGMMQDYVLKAYFG